jgi:hypothetical protein
VLAAIAPASAHHGTTQSATYLGGDVSFPADCSDPTTSSLGVACFEVGEAGLTNIRVDVADVTGIPTPAFAELQFTSGPTGGSRVCEVGDVSVPSGVTVVRVVVHVEPFAGDYECGIPGEFHAPVAGEINVTYS